MNLCVFFLFILSRRLPVARVQGLTTASFLFLCALVLLISQMHLATDPAQNFNHAQHIMVTSSRNPSGEDVLQIASGKSEFSCQNILSFFPSPLAIEHIHYFSLLCSVKENSSMPVQCMPFNEGCSSDKGHLSDPQKGNRNH